MDYQRLRPLRGVITAMVTPLKTDGTLDAESLERLIEHLLSGGVHGIFILGTTGEAPNLPHATRAALVERTCRLVAGRVPVLVGITDTCWQDAILLAEKAAGCGAVCVVAAPNYYFQVPQSDLLHYFQQLALASPLPLMLYNAPLNTHCWIEAATVIEAAAAKNICGVKDSGFNMGYFHQVQEGVKQFPDFTLLVGPDELLADAVLFGAHGGMAGGSNVFPRLFVDLYNAAIAQDLKRVAELQEQAIQFGNAVYRSADFAANPARGLKCALTELGLCGPALTAPLRPYSIAEQKRVQVYLRGVPVTIG